MRGLRLTKIEVELLIHRLEFLSIEDNAEDVFEDTDINPGVVATYAERMLALLKSGKLVLPVEHPIDLVILDDCAEDETYLEGASEEVENGTLTHQKLSSYHRAHASVKGKVKWLHQ